MATMKNVLPLALLCAQLGFVAAIPFSESEEQVLPKEYAYNRAATTYNLHYLLYRIKKGKDAGLDFNIPRDNIAAGELDAVRFFNQDAMYDLQVNYLPRSAPEISESMLLSNEIDHFSLTQQFRRYMTSVRDDPLSQGRKRHVILATTSPLNYETRRRNFERSLLPIEPRGLMEKAVPKVYQLMINSALSQSLMPKMLAASDVAMLAETLYDHMVRNPRILNLDSPVMQKYHYALVSNHIVKVEEEVYGLTVRRLEFDIGLDDGSDGNVLFLGLMQKLDEQYGRSDGSSWRYGTCEVAKDFGASFTDILPKDSEVSEEGMDLFIDKIVREQDEDTITFDENDCRLIPCKNLAGYVLVSTPQAQTYAFSESFYKMKDEDHEIAIPSGLKEMRSRLAWKLGGLRKLQKLNIVVLDDSFRTCADGLQYATTTLPTEMYSKADFEDFLNNFLLVVNEPVFEDMAKLFYSHFMDNKFIYFALTHRDVAERMKEANLDYLTSDNLKQLSENYLAYTSPSPNTLYTVKRDKLCEQLDEFVRNDDEHIVAVTGEVGIGKSSGVMSYIGEYSEGFGASTVVWIEAQTVESIKSSVTQFLDATPSYWYCSSETPSVEQMLHDLYRHFQYNPFVIFVFDNVEDIVTIRPYLPNSKLLRGLKIIVTSNTKEPISYLNPRELAVSGFSSDEVLSFINTRADYAVKILLGRLENSPIGLHPSILHYGINFLNVVSKLANNESTLTSQVRLFKSNLHNTPENTHPFKEHFEMITHNFPRNAANTFFQMDHVSMIATETFYEMAFLHYDRMNVKDYGWPKQALERLEAINFIIYIDDEHVTTSKYLQNFVTENIPAKERTVMRHVLEKQGKMLYYQAKPNIQQMSHTISIWERICRQPRQPQAKFQDWMVYLWQIENVIDGLMSDSESLHVASEFGQMILLKFHEENVNLSILGKYRLNITDLALLNRYWLQSVGKYTSEVSGEENQIVPKYSSQDLSQAIANLESRMSSQDEANQVAQLMIVLVELKLRQPSPDFAKISAECKSKLNLDGHRIDEILTLKLKLLHVNVLLLQNDTVAATQSMKEYGIVHFFRDVNKLLNLDTLRSSLLEYLHNDVTPFYQIFNIVIRSYGTTLKNEVH